MFKKNIEDFLVNYNYDFIHKENTTSTMYDVRNYLENRNKNCIYLSDQQSEGRGQRGNRWLSPSGNIYCSISFNNFLKMREHHLFSVLIALSIKMSLENFNAKNIYFKWPNDIFYKDKKFAGIISEVINIDDRNSYIIIGFGINFISAPQIKKYQATFVNTFCNIKSINDFFIVFLKILFVNLEQMQKGKDKKLLKTFSKYLMFIDKEICIVSKNNSTKNGVFRGINGDGSLKLEIEGKIESVYNGSIKL